MPDAATATTALEKPAERTPPVITTPEEYRSALLRWQQQKYTVLSPFTNMSSIAPQHGLLTSTVQISVNKDDQDVYDGEGGMPFLKSGEVALAKKGLRKIAECAGISTSTMRTDPRTIPHYWEMKCVASYRGVDGAIVTREATMEWDLRDGSDRLKGFKPGQITEARKNGLRNCESRAINAAIRECGCGLKQKYTAAELAKPFLVVRVMFLPDMSDPETRRVVTERALGGTATLYPQRALPGEVIDVTPEARSEPRESTTGAASTAAPERGEADRPNPDAVRIVKVDKRSGTKNGRAWTCFTVVDSNGVERTTFDTSIGDAAEKFEKAKTWVDITDQQNGDHLNIIELGPAQPSLLPDPGNL